MDDLVILLSALALCVCVLIVITVWSRRGQIIKWIAVLMMCPILVIAFMAFTTFMSRPKDVSFEWWLKKSEVATVLGADMHEKHEIFLWLRIDGVEEPRAYRLPWDQKTAQQLQDALEEAARNGTVARMRLPFEPTLDTREPKFYALPQPAMPPKDMTAPPVQRFVQPGQDA